MEEIFKYTWIKVRPPLRVFFHNSHIAVNMGFFRDLSRKPEHCKNSTDITLIFSIHRTIHTIPEDPLFWRIIYPSPHNTVPYIFSITNMKLVDPNSGQQTHFNLPNIFFSSSTPQNLQR